MDIENPLASTSNNLQGFKKFRNMEKMDQKEIEYVEKVIEIKNIGFNKNPIFSSKYDRIYDLLNYLLTIPKSQRFFIIKWFFDPHAPYNPPKKFRNKIKIDESKLHKNVKISLHHPKNICIIRITCCFFFYF